MVQGCLTSLRLEITGAGCLLLRSQQCWIIDAELTVGEEKARGHAFLAAGDVELIFELSPSLSPPAILSGVRAAVPEENNAISRLARNHNIHPRLIDRFVRNELLRCWFALTPMTAEAYVPAFAVRSRAGVKPLRFAGSLAEAEISASENAAFTVLWDSLKGTLSLLGRNPTAEAQALRLIDQIENHFKDQAD